MVNIVVVELDKRYRAKYYPSTQSIGLSKNVNEDNIFGSLEHESIHHVLAKLKEYNAYNEFDNIAKYLREDLEILPEKVLEENIESICIECLCPVSLCLCDLFKDSLGV